MRPNNTVLHLIKLSVGSESVETLAGWQESRRAHWRVLDGRPIARHLTRMTPRRGGEVLESGGSIFWVIKGVIQVRQRILGFEPARGADGTRYCAIMLDDGLVRVVPRAHRPFQGWRYLKGEDAPADIREGEEPDLPPRLAAELRELGLI